MMLRVADPVSTNRPAGITAASRRSSPAPSEHLLGWVLAALGTTAAAIAVVTNASDARAAAVQSWSPFVLVAGLLLVGLVADHDGLFLAAGHRLARAFRTGPVLFIGAAAMIGAVTALLNLDTSVAFLTPVFIYTARSRGDGEAPLLVGCLLLANAGSLFLPGSNLTNLIVLGHRHLTGGQFLSHMWLPALAALVVTAAVIGIAERRSLRATAVDLTAPTTPVIGVGLLAVAGATVLVVVLPSPALPVLAVGAIAVATRLIQRRHAWEQVMATLGVPVLVGLFGLAVGLGTLGRVWSAPATLLSHLDAWGTAGIAALGSVLFNNLPAASLLAARTPRFPFALLIGLNVGPNLFVTGSLAWILWLRAARTAGAQPSIAKATRLGLVAVPLSMAAAVGALAVTGSR
jgi:arsenical pump membrane protein